MTTDNDPFAVLEEAARQQDAEENLSRLIGKDKDDGKGGGDPQGKPQSDPGDCGEVQEPGDGTEAAK